MWSILLLGFGLAVAAEPSALATDAPAVDGGGVERPLSNAVHDMRADLNLASVDELASVYGIGLSKARMIVRDRIENGPFRNVNQLERVAGIGPSTVEKLRSHVKVGDRREAREAIAAQRAAPPIDPGPIIDINVAVFSEILDLPGIGASKARVIIADRDKRGPFRSCRALERVDGIGASTVDLLLPNCTASKVERDE